MNKGYIKIDGIGMDDQLADIFTKPLDESQFCKLRNELNIIDFSNVARKLAHVAYGSFMHSLFYFSEFLEHFLSHLLVFMILLDLFLISCCD